MVIVKDADIAAGLVDPVDNATSTSPGAVTTGERPYKPCRPGCGLAGRKRSIAELQHGGGNGFR